MSNVILLAEVLRRGNRGGLNGEILPPQRLDPDVVMNEAAEEIRNLRQERDDAMQAYRQRDMMLGAALGAAKHFHRKAQRAGMIGAMWGALAAALALIVVAL